MSRGCIYSLTVVMVTDRHPIPLFPIASPTLPTPDMLMLERVPEPAPGPEEEPEWTDVRIVTGVQRGERAALERLYAVYEPFLIRMAALFGVAVGDREMAAVEVLGDAALALMQRGVASPRSLPSYLGTSLRHWVEMRHRAAASYQRWCDAAAATAGPIGSAARVGAPPYSGHVAATDVEGVVTSVVSEHALRTSRGQHAVYPPVHPALLALAERLDQLINEEERYLLTWTSHGVPTRVAAGWLGISYAVAAKRMSRLRARLRVAAMGFADTLAPEERRHLERFFARAASVSPIGKGAASNDTTDGSDDATRNGFGIRDVNKETGV